MTVLANVLIVKMQQMIGHSNRLLHNGLKLMEACIPAVAFDKDVLRLQI